jgi:Uma2 family endonuclease
VNDRAGTACYSLRVAIRHLDASDVRPLRRVEYDRLVELGAFETERVELIEGLIVRMSPHGPKHDGTIDILVEELTRQLGDRARVRVQCAFVAGDQSEPEPDIAVVPKADYRSEHPRRAHLVVEVADSSLERDRGAKAAMYAASGVEDYWVVDVAGKAIEVHRQPTAGGYRSVQRITTGRVDLLEFADVALPVEKLF